MRAPPEAARRGRIGESVARRAIDPARRRARRTVHARPRPWRLARQRTEQAPRTSAASGRGRSSMAGPARVTPTIALATSGPLRSSSRRGPVQQRRHSEDGNAEPTAEVSSSCDASRNRAGPRRPRKTIHPAIRRRARHPGRETDPDSAPRRSAEVTDTPRRQEVVSTTDRDPRLQQPRCGG